ncbi:hypothetical protein G7Y79_00017g043970 [Physcia stellaris]|nr:hypothetical protein G7Y79_00017g043970 [Physcia stellaris]
MLRSSPRFGRLSLNQRCCRPVWVTVQHIRHCQRPFASRRQVDQPEQQPRPVIRWFKQFLPGSSRRKEIDPESENPDDDLPEARVLRARIDQLEAEIAELHGKDKPTLIEPLIATLSAEEQAKVRKALAEEEEEEDDLYENDIALLDLPKLEKLAPKLDLELEQAVYLRKLDKSLRAAADNVSSASTRLELWHTYCVCKNNLPSFLHLVPVSIFRVLWESQQSAQGPHRASHLCVLAQDIIHGGNQLSEQQVLLFIDSLIRQARPKDALHQWQEEVHRLGDNDLTRLEFNYLGVRIYSAMDNPEKAQEIAMSILPIEKDMISSVLIPVMIAWVRRGDERSLKNAWALYLRLRTDLGAEMAVKDFDNISLTLLHCGQTDMALAVFKDLMLSNTDTPETHDQLYRASIRLVGTMHSQSVDAAQLAKVSLAALIAMPRQFQNKFFYGSWLKHLIGKGEVDAAAAVLELMMERGVKTDARHLNGILAAWLRKGSDTERAKAEQLGWAMIAQRLEFVQARRGQAPDPSAREEFLRVSRWPRHVQRFMALATTETFSILLLDFDRRGRKNFVRLLQKYFIEAELKPNSYYVNHMMFAQLRQGHYREAFDVYETMSPHVLLDLQTFACLWDCEKGHLDRIKLKRPDSFPGPRVIMGKMISWFSGLSKRAHGQARAECSRSFYNQVLRCMCLNRDLQGTIVALWVMKDLFGLYPDHVTTRMITIEVACIATGQPRMPSSRARPKPSIAAKSQNNIGKMSELLRLVTEQRGKILQQRGINAATLSDGEQKEELLINLIIYLQTVMRQTVLEPDDIEKRIELAAGEMGVPGVSQVVKRFTA